MEGEKENMSVGFMRPVVFFRGRRRDSCVRSGQEAAVGVVAETQGGREWGKVGADGILSGDDTMGGQKDGGNISRGVR